MPDSMKEKTKQRMIGNVFSEDTLKKIGLANSKYYNIYDNEDNLVLSNVRVNDEVYKQYEFPATFTNTAKRDYKMYENAKNIREKFKKYKNWYMVEVKNVI